MRAATLLLLACLAAPACAVDLPPLPANPGEAGDAPAADGPEGAVEAILPGVLLLEPSLDADTATAAFRVRNDTGGDLPDLILVAIFDVGPADGTGASLPRFETIEAPMRRGETRRFRATLATLAEGEQVRGLRVAAGVPQQVTAREEGVAGTTFLGGILECVGLEADLTGPHRGVKVTLAVRGDAAADAALPELEVQLLCGRAGDLVWSGPWVLVPRGDPAGGMARRIRWNLDGAPGLGGCDVFLRVREKR